MTYTIKSLGHGWYSFKDCPQEGRYIKIDGLNCGDDKTAIKRAKKYFGKQNNYEVAK